MLAKHLEALVGDVGGDLDRPAAPLVEAARCRGPEPPAPWTSTRRARDPLDGGYGRPRRCWLALELLLAVEMGSDEVGRSLWLAASRSTTAIALELCDADPVHALATRQLAVAREAGALVQLRLALNFLGGSLIFSGELARAELLFDEDRLVAEATGNQPVLFSEMLVEIWRGREAKATELLEATRRGRQARAGWDGSSPT